MPPASKLVKIAGDSQTAIVNAALALPLAVRVEDALSGGVPGTSVTWSVQSGSAAIVPTTTISDTGGNVQVVVTPSSLGTVKVQATSGSLAGSPITFTINVLAGTVRQVIISPKLDTIAKGATAQFTAVLKDSLGNVISTIKPTWTSSNGAVATVDSNGLATWHWPAIRLGSSRPQGGFADTARLFVRAPAKVALTPSDTVITAIGDSLHLSGVVLTNFGDTVKTATLIRFSTTTPTVATVDPVTGEAHVVGAGIGIILAVDTIGKDSGTATLRVNQKVDSLHNTPPDSILVGINGQAQIIAVAMDRNGHPIPGKTFGWISRNTTVATISQTGVVTGHSSSASTYAVDSLIDSVTVFKDSTKVVGVLAPPPVFQWAFDTLAIGNGGNTTVNISLNVASVAGTVMQIVSSDTTRVKPTQTRIAIGTGGASASVTLNALAATLAPVQIVAQDSAGIYKPDTLNVIVVSTLFFALPSQTTRTQDYYLNQGETENAQIFLSDPAPLGGLGVTFTYGKPGTSTVVPTTVIIPQGQLSAPVTFLGTASGTDSVIPTSGAFAGKFSYLHVAPDTLRMVQNYPYTGNVGLGQAYQVYVQIGYGMDHILPFTASVSNGIATVPSPDTILLNSSTRSFNVVGVAKGTGVLNVAAPHSGIPGNWPTTTIPITVSTPRLIAGGSTSIIAGAPPSAGYWSANTADSLNYQHPVTVPVIVTATSRDTTVIKVLVSTDTVLVNNASSSAGSALQAQPGAGGDSTYLVVSAPGYRSDSILIHVTRPTMSASYNYPYDGRVALNTTFPQAIYVGIPYARTDTFALVLHHSNQAIVAASDTILIPKGLTNGFLPSITGVALGLDSISIDTVATAPGYVLPSGTVWVLHVDSIHVRVYTAPTSLVTISPPQVVGVYAVDAVNNQNRPLLSSLRVNLAVGKPGVVTLDSAAVTIPAGQSISNYDTLRIAGTVTPPDSTRVLFTAPGSSPDSTGLIKVTATPLNVFINSSGYVGRGMKNQTNYAYLPAAAPNTLTVALSHTVPGKDTLVPSFVTILKGASSSNYFEVWGTDSTGTDTIVASASGFTPGKFTVRTPGDTLVIGRPGFSQLTTNPPFRLFGYEYVKGTGVNQKPVAATTVTFVSTNPNVINIDSGLAVNATHDTVTALIDTTRGYATVRINWAGPGPAYLKLLAPGYAPDSIGPFNVTGPSLTVNLNSTTVGVGQYINGSVSVQNAVTGSPLAIGLQRSDSTALPGSQVFLFAPSSLTIPVASYSTQQDTIFGQNVGTAQILATAPGYGSSFGTVQVGQPRLAASYATLPLWVGARPTQVYAYTQDQTNGYRNVSVATLVTTAITDGSVVTVDSAQRTVSIHQDSPVNAFQFSASKQGSVQVYFTAPNYKPDTMLVTADTGTLTLGVSNLGVGEVSPVSVNIPYGTLLPVVVTLTSSNPSVLRVPATVTILAGSSNVSFSDTGMAAGSATITASAPGILRPSTAAGVTVSTPRLIFSISSNANAGQALGFNVYSQDSAGSYHPVASNVTVTLASSAPGHTVFTPPTPTILAGNQNVSSQVTFDSAGVYTLTATAPGFTNVPSVVTVSGVEIKVGVGNATTFTPGTDTVAVNHYATWVWDSTNAVNHQIHWLTGPGSLPGDSPTQASGSYQVYFTTPGTYTYWCTIHTVAMQGTIVVQ